MSHRDLIPVIATPPTTESRTVPRSRRDNDLARGRRYLTRDEVHRLIRAARDNRHGVRDALMLRMAFEHGLRVSELVGLRWSAVNLATHELTVSRVKGSLDGTHPLQGTTVRALKRYQRVTGRTSGLVFVNERGTPVSADGFRRLLHRLSERVLGVKWHPHALRHACGVHLINRGVDLRTVQQYLGHANIQNTVAYTALTGRPFERLTF